MSFRQGVIQPGAFLELVPVHWIAAQQLARRVAALTSQIVQFKNESYRLADRNFYVPLSFVHVQTMRF